MMIAEYLTTIPSGSMALFILMLDNSLNTVSELIIKHTRTGHSSGTIPASKGTRSLETDSKKYLFHPQEC